MGSKKNKKATANSTNPPALRIGSRVRCNDDGVLGRIVWANAVSVKIKWDDGEQVTWRRDALASKPIEILDDESAPASEATTEQPTAETQAESSAVPTPTEQPTTAVATKPEEEQPDILGFDQYGAPYHAPAIPEQTTTEPQAPVTEPTTEPAAPAIEQPITWNVLDAAPESANYMKVIGSVTAVTLGDAQAAAKALYTTPHIVRAPEAPAPEPGSTEAASAEQPASGTADATPAKPKRERKSTEEPKERKPSAIDAAARVLAEEGRPMSCKELIGVMASKGYWSSPGGKTPDATLYSAILREIDTKGTEARFVKVGRGQFSRKS